MPCGADWVEQAAFSPDGKRVATRAGRHLRVWRTGGELAFEFSQHESTVAALAWRADSGALASACYGRIRAWRLSEPQPYEDITWKGSFLALAWSPTARFLCGGTQEGTIQFFRLPAKQNEPLQMSGYPSKIRNLAWDREGRWLASDGGSVVIVWDVSGKGPANTEPRQLEGHPGRVSALDYQAAGPLLASGCEKGGVFIWNPARAETQLQATRLSAGIATLRWSHADGRLAVGTLQGEVAVFKLP
jgi:WD40 repeat protein